MNAFPLFLTLFKRQEKHELFGCKKKKEIVFEKIQGKYYSVDLSSIIFVGHYLLVETSKVHHFAYDRS